MLRIERRNEILDEVLEYNKRLRETTREMNNEERVFFLETLGMSIKTVEDIFRKALDNDIFLSALGEYEH
jgi:hypothetical protein